MASKALGAGGPIRRSRPPKKLRWSPKLRECAPSSLTNFEASSVAVAARATTSVSISAHSTCSSCGRPSSSSARSSTRPSSARPSARTNSSCASGDGAPRLESGFSRAPASGRSSPTPESQVLAAQAAPAGCMDSGAAEVALLRAAAANSVSRCSRWPRQRWRKRSVIESTEAGSVGCPPALSSVVAALSASVKMASSGSMYASIDRSGEVLGSWSTLKQLYL
eukprot:2562411-Prymnesium_polylepis.1